MAQYYIDGTTLNNALAVYDDAQLTTCAPAGFYSDGVSSREQVVNGNSCYLLPPQPCPTCATPCGSNLNGNGNQGVYLLDMDVGGTANDTGAIIVRFDPASVPDGVQVVYDGNVYNKLSSPTEGLLQSSVAGVPTYVGRTTSDTCGVQAGTFNQTLNVFQYQGNQFVPTGTTQNVSIVPGQGQLTANAPGNCVMVIPKPNPSPSTINCTFIGPCGGTVFSINVSCPQPLNCFMSSQTAADLTTVCNQGTIPVGSIYTSFYHVQVAQGSVQGFPVTNDYVFVDHDAVSFPADGYYLHHTGYIYELVDGVVVQDNIAVCSTYTVSDCLSGNSYTMTRFGGTLNVGDVVKYRKFVTVNGCLTVENSTSCGTITSVQMGGSTNSVQEAGSPANCQDASAGCPQNA